MPNSSGKIDYGNGWLVEVSPGGVVAVLMVAATNAAMDCFARASSDAAEVRDLELNYAVKLSLFAAALSKAF